MKLDEYTRNARIELLGACQKLSPEIGEVMEPSSDEEALLSSLGAIVQCGANERYLNVDVEEPISGQSQMVDCFVTESDFLDFKFKLVIKTPPLADYPAFDLAPVCVAWLSGQKDAGWVLSKLRQVRWGSEVFTQNEGGL